MMDVSWSQLKAAGAAYDKQEQPQAVAGFRLSFLLSYVIDVDL